MLRFGVFFRHGRSQSLINDLRLGICFTADLDVAVAAEFDEQRLGWRRTYRRRGRGCRLLDDDRRLRCGILRSRKIIRIKRIEKGNVVRAGATIEMR